MLEAVALLLLVVVLSDSNKTQTNQLSMSIQQCKKVHSWRRPWIAPQESVPGKEVKISLYMVKEQIIHYIIHILDIVLHITFMLKDINQARKK